MSEEPRRLAGSEAPQGISATRPARDLHRPPRDSDQWEHVEIRLSELFRQLRWLSPPVSWAVTRLQAVYFAIESTGATSTSIEIKGYHVRHSRK
jgi:hypothetical protein